MMCALNKFDRALFNNFVLIKAANRVTSVNNPPFDVFEEFDVL